MFLFLSFHLTFLFLWQQIAQNCQKNNIKIWWISEDWDSVSVIIMVKVNTFMGILHILYWSIKLLWEESYVLSQVCNVSFNLHGVSFHFCSSVQCPGNAVLPECCDSCSVAVQCCGLGWAACSAACNTCSPRHAFWGWELWPLGDFPACGKLSATALVRDDEIWPIWGTAW